MWDLISEGGGNIWFLLFGPIFFRDSASIGNYWDVRSEERTRLDLDGDFGK